MNPFMKKPSPRGLLIACLIIGAMYAAAITSLIQSL